MARGLSGPLAAGRIAPDPRPLAAGTARRPSRRGAGERSEAGPERRCGCPGPAAVTRMRVAAGPGRAADRRLRTAPAPAGTRRPPDPGRRAPGPPAPAGREP